MVVKSASFTAGGCWFKSQLSSLFLEFVCLFPVSRLKIFSFLLKIRNMHIQ